MRLNDEQQRAVDLTEGPVILVSCPGSGKTTTLLARINNIIRKGIPPEKILMVTFTKAAADEMAEKYKRNMDRLMGYYSVPSMPYACAFCLLTGAIRQTAS